MRAYPDLLGDVLHGQQPFEPAVEDAKVVRGGGGRARCGRPRTVGPPRLDLRRLYPRPRPRLAGFGYLSSLVVVSECSCGCASIDFGGDPPGGPRSALVADAVAKHPDGSMLGLMVWGHPDQITALELYDDDASGGNKRLPDPASVRSFYPT